MPQFLNLVSQLNQIHSIKKNIGPYYTLLDSPGAIGEQINPINGISWENIQVNILWLVIGDAPKLFY